MTARTALTVDAPDGPAAATLHTPDAGPHPGVIMFADAAGVRETLRSMADTLASSGYAVLLPDIHYRLGDVAPFDLPGVFGDPDERARLLSYAAELTTDRLRADVVAYADALLGRQEVRGNRIATTGYCLGGTASLLAAGTLGERVAAAASFHGGGLALADDPGSPHLLAPDIRASVLVAGARDDPSFTPEQASLLRDALERAGVAHTVETYPAAHGFAVPDNPTYDPDAARRHRHATTALFESVPSYA